MRVVVGEFISPDGVVQAPINGVQKYVVSDSLAGGDLTWGPATIIRGADLVRRVSELREEPGGDVYVYAA